MLLTYFLLNQPSIFTFHISELSDKVYSNTQVPTQVNTNQRESDTNQHKSKTSQHESDESQHKSNTSQHESARLWHESTQVN